MVALCVVVLLQPEAIEVGMLHPEDRVGGCGIGIGHRTPDPYMTDPCTPFIGEANDPNVADAMIDGTFDAIIANDEVDPDARTTVNVRVGVTTVGRTLASRAGTDCSLALV